MVASVLRGDSFLLAVTLRLKCLSIQVAEMTFAGPREGCEGG